MQLFFGKNLEFGEVTLQFAEGSDIISLFPMKGRFQLWTNKPTK